MRISFRALLPKKAWEWNEKSEVYMRFGRSQFGDFKYDVGPGEIER